MTGQLVNAEELMAQSGVKAGTSGLRGKASALTDKVAYVYARAFLQYLDHRGQGRDDPSVIGVAGDLRSSTDRIMCAVARAGMDVGCRPINCGKIPSPAAVLWGIKNCAPSAMVTASHNPDDENGLKFTTGQGEITKEDERGIAEQIVPVPGEIFDEAGMLKNKPQPFEESYAARELYLKRYRDFFPSDLLTGMRVGVYQHTAVGRDILVEIYGSLGAQVVALGRTQNFVAVDTEAISEQDQRRSQAWLRDENLDLVVSTDGDSDRPLTSDETGRWIRGDVAGILAARYVRADVVVTPVSCNTAVMHCNWFPRVLHDEVKIGSPYVLAEMQRALNEGAGLVVGYEGNGGFLQMGCLEREGRVLEALPTRDAVIVHLAVVALGKSTGKSISSMLKELPARFTASGRLKGFPRERAIPLVERLAERAVSGETQILDKIFKPYVGNIHGINITDGLRMSFRDCIIHLRSSRNADDFRCYTEASSSVAAQQLVNTVLDEVMAPWEHGKLPV